MAYHSGIAGTGPDRLVNEETIWTERYRSIVDMEEHLHRNGTRTIKFSLADIHERKFWNRYMKAFEKRLSAASTADAPWHVVPADDNKNVRLIVSQIILDTFKDLKMAYPETTAKRRQELKSIRKQLMKGAQTSS